MEYKQKAEKFLIDTKTIFEIREAQATEQKSPLWSSKDGKHGIHYICTLKNENHKYTFDFWGSIRDAEIIEAIKEFRPQSLDFGLHDKYKKIFLENKIRMSSYFSKEQRERLLGQYRPDAYSVLACLDVNHDTFEDFCLNFGYNEDSRIAYKIYKAVQEQSNNLHALFTSEEIKLLQEIN